MSFSPTEAAERVLRGAAWLDENHPGWENNLDLSKLEMSQCDWCVLGQAVGSYWDTVEQATFALVEQGLVVSEDYWAVDNGFVSPTFFKAEDVGDGSYSTLDFDTEAKYYVVLEGLWAMEVKKRRNDL